MKNIFVIGQCTLHWGRMEFGNIGNYYIIEPFFRELHRVFPQANIKTTFQMSDGFCEREHVQCVPTEYYYAWDETYLTVAEKELAIASSYYETHELKETTPYIDEVLRSDLIIDFSGDIWGRNADLVGPNRFLIGLMKDRVVQLLGKPIAMLAGSPGPFNDDEILPFAKQVFEGFSLVTNREPISRSVLEAYGFETSKVVDLACPAFMFEPASSKDIAPFIQGTPIENKEKPTIGFVLCGWNMIQGPFNREDWKDEEFVQYVELITHIVRDFDVNVCLMSHSNGFILPPNFKLIKGRDYPIVEQLYRILQKTEMADSVYLMDGLYDPKITKGIIANFDMLISGRVHAAVAGLSQNVPTVIIDYGHEPKAHKLQGFALVAAVQKYVANPADKDNLIEVVDACWNNRKIVAQDLEKRNLAIKELIHKNFNLLRDI